jgi:hypothetical protein
MRERGISTIAAVALTAVAGMVTALVMMDWVVVDVQTYGQDSVHVVVPCPLLVPRIAANLVPDEALQEAKIPPEVRQYRENVIDAVAVLNEIPDTVLVKVDSRDAQVEVKKEGDDLLIAVDADDAVVRCKVPIDGIYEALDEWDWETVDPDMIFDLLSEAGNGNLVTVESEEARVVINLW